MLAQPKLVLIILAVRDLPRAVAFYRAAFDWPIRVEVPVYVEMEMPGGQRVGLYHHEGFARNTGLPAAGVPAEHTAATELYFHTEELPATIERLRQAGARLLSAPALRPWGDEAAYFADPARMRQDEPRPGRKLMRAAGRRVARYGSGALFSGRNASVIGTGRTLTLRALT
jgi:predicted enzyme related to lactoylglutathione lyase